MSQTTAVTTTAPTAPTVRNPQRERIDAWLRLLRSSAESFAIAQPLSVSEVDLKRSVDRCISAFRAVAASNDEVMQCSHESVARAIANSALFNLLPGGPLPDVYLLPQRNGQRLDLDWRISWRGYVTLAARAGYRLRVVPVFEGETFDYGEGLFPFLDHRPSSEVRQDYDALTHVYVVAHRAGAPRDEVPAFMVVSKSTIEARRNASASRNGPWAKWPLEMAHKAAVRYCIQRGLVTLDPTAAATLAAALEADRGPVVDAQPAAENTYFIEPATQSQPRGLQAVVAAAESRAPVEPPSSGSQGSAGASDNAPAKRGRGRPRKESAPVDHVAEAQRQERQRLLGHAKAAVGELSGAEYEALRERLGLGEDADLGDLGAEQLDRVVREASAIVDERGEE